jgi:hypothetical protein
MDTHLSLVAFIDLIMSSIHNVIKTLRQYQFGFLLQFNIFIKLV